MLKVALQVEVWAGSGQGPCPFAVAVGSSPAQVCRLKGPAPAAPTSPHYLAPPPEPADGGFPRAPTPSTFLPPRSWDIIQVLSVGPPTAPGCRLHAPPPRQARPRGAAGRAPGHRGASPAGCLPCPGAMCRGLWWPAGWGHAPAACPSRQGRADRAGEALLSPGRSPHGHWHTRGSVRGCPGQGPLAPAPAAPRVPTASSRRWKASPDCPDFG